MHAPSKFFVLFTVVATSLLAADRPNVLFIICDDLNTHVSTSGYKHTKTPSMDALAAAGTTFNRAYCQYPVCGPSRASLLSGLYPESTKVVDNKAEITKRRTGTISMPQMMKEAGYWTGGVGKTFHNPKTNPGEIAWHEYHRFENEHNPVEVRLRKAFTAKHGSPEEPKNNKKWRAHLKENRHLMSGQTPPGNGPTGMTDAEHKDGKNVRQIAKWLDKKAYGDKPFFMTCGIQKPHVPYWAPQKYFDMYPLDKLQPTRVPADDWQDVPKRAFVKRYESFGFKAAKENDALRRQYMQAYHACISFLDAQIGLIFDALKRNGQWENTIIVLTSDHGYHMGEHFMWGKVTLFEECARVPMIIRAPGLTKPGTRSEALVELIDIMPTFADLCNVTLPETIHGTSLRKQLLDPTQKGKDAIYTVVSRGPKLGRAIRTVRWRYAEWDTPDQNELYDLQADPNEYNNLATRPEYREIVSSMRKTLNQKRQKATLLTTCAASKKVQ